MNKARSLTRGEGRFSCRTGVFWRSCAFSGCGEGLRRPRAAPRAGPGLCQAKAPRPGCARGVFHAAARVRLAAVAGCVRLVVAVARARLAVVAVRARLAVVAVRTRLAVVAGREARTRQVEQQLQEQRGELQHTATKLQKLQSDFQYNLGLLDERDQELEVYDREYARLQAEAADCLLYTSPSPRDQRGSRMAASA